uniref:Uncharacterized protein n=1 Tax=Anguilla anguilla TaxID=7936 RepID=A0A0E9RTE5_ANGAN
MHRAPFLSRMCHVIQRRRRKPPGCASYSQ